MFKRSLVTVGALATLSLVGAACSGTPAATPPTTTPVTNTNAPATVTPPAHQPKTVVISMTDDGFTPSQLSITVGDTVRFMNNGALPHWPASAPHPTHTNYPEFDPRRGIAPGQSWTFTFTKSGAWGFHDHLNASHFGKVTVTP